ncbi:MAG: S41 family peptidase [Patescibacteria group bacterium]|nr:S41 family peptidase [Patescibacteria group bacterium]
MKKIKNLKIFLILFILTLNIALAFNINKSKKEYSFFLSLPQFKKEYNELLWQVWQKINTHYIEQQNINPDKAAFEAIRGVVKSLDDQYSEIYTPQQAKIFEQDLEGKFCGMGAEIGIRNNILTIIAPLEGTPAERAGIEPGDMILKINNESTTKMPLEEAVSKIRGKCGEKVILTIFRESWKEEKNIEIIREEIKILAIKSEFIPPNIGYIKINNFNQTTLPEFIKAYQTLKLKGVDRYILDVRNNPGGYLETAIQISELFIPRGKIILKEVWGKEKKKKNVISEGPGGLAKEKIVILVNKGSASASEIFAGTLRDNLGVKLIGEKTFGKGSVQQVFKIKDYLLKLTVAYWLTPSEVKLEGQGLEPDIKIEDKKEEKENKKDLILEKAKEIISQY